MNRSHSRGRPARNRSIIEQILNIRSTRDKVDLLLKLLPPACFMYVHFTYPDLDERIRRWGASFKLLKSSSNFHRCITHIAVHANEEHLWKNLIAYFSAVLFWPRDRDIFTFYGVFFGGALAGLFATDLEQKRDRQIKATDFSLGFGFIERAVNYVYKKWQHNIEFCGASAAIYSIMSYTATTRNMINGALSLLFSEALSTLISKEYSDTRLNFPQISIGHWAHIGGIMFGLCMGVIDAR